MCRSFLSTVTKKEIFAWATYDFANSPFPTIINAVLFNVYFTKVVVGQSGAQILGFSVPPSSLWTYAVALSTLLILLTAPVLGAIADYTGTKKRFLFAFCYAGCLFTGLLYFATEGRYLYGAICYILANYAFAGSFAFYNSFLPEISTEENIGRISGFGWGFGFFGGALALVVSLIILKKPDFLAIPSIDHLPERVVFLFVALWWAVFAVFAFLHLQERAARSPLKRGEPYVRLALGRLVHTLSIMRQHKELFKYLGAFLVYSIGVETVMVLSAVIGSELLDIKPSEMMLAFIVGQFIAVIGAIVLGMLADRLGNRTIIIATLAAWVAVVFWAFFMKSKAEFWTIGGVLAFIIAGTQSASRSLFGLFTPTENTAEFFGIYVFTGKLGSFIGPLTFGITVQYFTTNPIESIEPLRIALLTLAVFLLAGIALLGFVNEGRGIEESARPVE